MAGKSSIYKGCSHYALKCPFIEDFELPCLITGVYHSTCSPKKMSECGGKKSRRSCSCRGKSSRFIKKHGEHRFPGAIITAFSWGQSVPKWKSLKWPVCFDTMACLSAESQSSWLLWITRINHRKARVSHLKKKMTHQNGAFCVCGPDRTSGNAGAFLDRHSTNLKDAAPELQVDLLYNPR